MNLFTFIYFVYISIPVLNFLFIMFFLFWFNFAILHFCLLFSIFCLHFQTGSSTFCLLCSSCSSLILQFYTVVYFFNFLFTFPNRFFNSPPPPSQLLETKSRHPCSPMNREFWSKHQETPAHLRVLNSLSFLILLNIILVFS